jgi:tripartite-type tricarboxylate transporter receptor subunit TctC
MTRSAFLHRSFRFLAFACFALPLLGVAQTYPTKPIRVVIPYPPGGVDIVIRLIVPALEKSLGQPIILDYRPGAGGLIGTEHVARAAPDGYTLLATVANSWINLPALKKQTPYDPIKDLTPVGLLMESVSLIVAHPSFPANNMSELIAYAKSNPGKVVYATSGIGGAQHLEGEMIQRLAGIDWVHAPFQGFGPMIPAITGGQVPIGFITFAVAKGFLSTGKWKLIAVTNSDAIGKSMAPAGAQIVSDVVPGFEAMPVWMAFGGPAGLPRAIVNRWNEAIAKAQRESNVVDRYVEDKQVNIATTPEVFERRVRNDYELVRKMIANARIPPQD